MTVRAPRWPGSLSTLFLCTLISGIGAGCKPDATAAEAPAEASSPPASQAPEAQEGPGEPAGAEEGATLAAGTPTVGEPDALDPQPEPANTEIAAVDPEPETPAVPEEPYKVLILGDSLAATGFGALLERRLDAHPHVVCYRKGKSASGLARPDFFDWYEEGKKQVEFREPDMVVVIMGGNDGQDLTRRKNGEGKRVSWKHEDWAAEYRARVDSFLGKVSAPGRKIVWLGLPTMGLRSLEQKLTLIRDVQQNAVEALGDDALYLDTVPFVTTDAGEMLTEAKVGPRGKTHTIRADDRIHFTMAGSEYFADRVYPEILQALGLTDVQGDPAAEPSAPQPAAQ
ncbi:SGNH/GDSL hydrolase family protein [Paraliomyxa miuraensis]|uniref:SGNH/GDSL hydrolase family protein n=1 Tax=Paraliomyxa miuraensis TaxID=376150 RepID=UPI00225AD5A6|nr:DUF459 domain-containing protein [Paraliomyxa miuraensis]MCX4243739.1 DUF459 domain-containing protein [Paraliomyxa miuraensis]